jgi:hypothetical protein
MATTEKSVVDVGELEDDIGVHELDDAHCILLFEPCDMDGEVRGDEYCHGGVMT